MIEKSIKKIMHRMRDRFLRAYIDAKNAYSNFSILTKICQRIKSISMRKDSIFSTLFVFLDRILVLRNQNVIWLYSTLFRNRIIRRQIFVILNTFFRNDIDSTFSVFSDCIVRFFRNDIIWFQFLFTKLYIVVANSLKIRRCNRLTRNTSLKQTHCCCNCTIRFFETILLHTFFFLVTFDRSFCFSFFRIYRSISRWIIVLDQNEATTKKNSQIFTNQ